jgi:hypothetical protein
MIKIYKVQALDVLGKEIADFGFYEAIEDAERRRGEIAAIMALKGTVEIKEIDVVPSSKKTTKEFEGAPYYELKTL